MKTPQTLTADILLIRILNHLQEKHHILFSSFFLFFIFYCNVALSQAPPIQWQKSLGGRYDDQARSVQKTMDGGYIIAGNSSSAPDNHGLEDAWIVKLNANGDIQWQKSFGGSGNDYAYSIQQTKEGGYIVAGISDSKDGDLTNNYGDEDFWVIKLNSSGDKEWQKSIGSPFYDEAICVRPTNDGGYIVAGDTKDQNNGSNYMIVKLDTNGDIQWQKKAFGGSSSAVSVQQTHDGGYIVAGYVFSDDTEVSGNHGSYDYLIIKLNAQGDAEWKNAFGGSAADIVASVLQTTEGGYIVGGYTLSNDGDVSSNQGGQHAWILKLDGNGKKQWDKSVGGPNAEEIYDMQPTDDGGFILCGLVRSGPDLNGYILKINSTADLVWEKNIGGSAIDYFYSVQQATDGGYIIAGASMSKDGDLSSNQGYADSWVVKLCGKPLAPDITISSSSATICAGASITFTATPTNGGTTPVYQWKKNGTNVGTNSATYTDAALSNSDKITCELTSNDPCANPKTAISNEITVTVSTAVTPTISITSTATNICAGGSVTFTATPTNGGTTPVYQWKKNGVNVGNNSATYTDAALNNNDKISCESTSNNPCASPKTAISNEIIINVASSLTPAINISTTVTNICAGTSITFTATSTNGGTSPVYQWKKNGINDGTNSATYTDAALSNSDKITCELTSNDPCANPKTAISNEITVTVSTAVTSTISITSTATNICSGSSVAFTATPTNGGTTPIYQWKKNGVNVGTNSVTYTDAALSNNDKISCELTSNDPCANPKTAISNDIIITAGTGVTPTVSISSTATVICLGSSVTFTATPTDGGTTPIYQWKKNGTNVGSNSPTYTDAALNDNDKITCELTSNNQCAIPATVVSNVIIMSKALPASISISSSATAICKGDKVTFTAMAANAGQSPVYSWLLNGVEVANNSSTYSTTNLSDKDNITCVIMPQGNSCSTDPVSSNVISVTINPLPVITINPADTAVVKGSQVTLNALINGNISSYQWSPASGLIGSTTLTPTTTPINTETNYWLYAKSKDGCAVNTKAVIRVANKLLIPNSFTPNGDGLNDVFRIPPNTAFRLKDFSVYNRWGQRIFFTTDINKGWNGLNHPIGTYLYIINGTDNIGGVALKGTVMLIR